MAGGGRITRERAAKAGVLAVMAALFLLALVIFVLPFAFPTPPPIITRFQSTVVFSPNDDGRRDVARINLRVNEPSRVTLEIAGDGETVATLLDDRPLPRGWNSVTWDGRDAQGRPVPDGGYAIRLRARSGGKRFNASRAITVDTAAPAPAAFSVESATLGPPGPPGCRVSFVARDAGSVLLEALRPGDDDAIAHRGPLPAPAGREVRWSWRGYDAERRPVDPGLYAIRATLSDPSGNRTVRERTCWVGRLAGSVRPREPGPRTAVSVSLRRPDGTPLADDAVVALEFRRRAGTPGRGITAPLGPRVGARVAGRAGALRITTPAGIRPDALWLVARLRDGSAVALIGLGAP